MSANGHPENGHAGAEGTRTHRRSSRLLPFGTTRFAFTSLPCGRLKRQHVGQHPPSARGRIPECCVGLSARSWPDASCAYRTGRARAILAVDTFILALEGTAAANLFPGSIFYFFGRIFLKPISFLHFSEGEHARSPPCRFSKLLPLGSDPVSPQEAVNAAPIGVHKGARAAQFASERCVTVPVTPPCPNYFICLSIPFTLLV